MKEIINPVLETRGKSVKIFLDVGLNSFLEDGVRMAVTIQVSISWFAVLLSLVMAYTSYHSHRFISEQSLETSALASRALWDSPNKDLVNLDLVLSSAKPELSGKNWKCLIIDKMYKTAGDNLQRGENTQRQQTWLKFNNPQGYAIFFYWNIDFSLSTITWIFTKDNRSKTNVQNKSSLIKLGLIIYIRATRIIIEHLGSFQSALLEL